MDGIETVLYESPYFANIKIDRKPAPYGILYLIAVAELDLTNNLKETAEMEVFFADTVQFGADGMTQQTIIDKMMDLAKEFVALLKADKTVVIDDNIRMVSSYAKFDKNVTGVSIQFTIRERQSKCLDSIEPEQRVLKITANGEYEVTQIGKIIVNVEW